MLDLTRVGNWYHGYIKKVTSLPIIEAIQNNTDVLSNFFDKLPKEKQEYRYADGKWTIKEIVQHLIDSERIFSYRALCLARGEKQPLPGFDENAYADEANKSTRDWNDLVEEFKILRQSTLLLFKTFSAQELERDGIASDNPCYVLGIGYVIIGHCLHHKEIIEERYL